VKPRKLIAATALLLALATGTAGAAGLATHSLTVDGRERIYNDYSPVSYDGQRPLPAVIMLHGAGATGTGVIAETGWDKKADQQNFLAVFPDAVRADPSSPPGFLTNPQLWNDGSGRGQSFLAGVDDVRFLELLIADLSANMPSITGRCFSPAFPTGRRSLSAPPPSCREDSPPLPPWPAPAGLCRPIWRHGDHPCRPCSSSARPTRSIP
jgi:polyhydroxybutyrate depolymerase